jgi:hypothetical protein
MQIVSLSLTELMLLLAFMAIAFSFLAREEALREVPRMQAQLDDALQAADRLRHENAELSTKLGDAVQDDQRLTQFLQRVQIDSATLMPEGEAIRFDAAHVYELSAGSMKAPGHPQCPLAGRYLLKLYLLANSQIKGAPLWDAKDAAGVSGLPGLAALGSGQPLSLKNFGGAAKSVHDASLKNSGCVFAVQVIRQTRDADAFDAELLAVERYFDVSHR